MQNEGRADLSRWRNEIESFAGMAWNGSVADRELREAYILQWIHDNGDNDDDDDDNFTWGEHYCLRGKTRTHCARLRSPRKQIGATRKNGT